jgi:hypothetical protein
MLDSLWQAYAADPAHRQPEPVQTCLAGIAQRRADGFRAQPLLV